MKKYVKIIAYVCRKKYYADGEGCKMLADNLTREQIVEKYTSLIEPLFVYIPWLEKVSGGQGSSVYGSNGIAQNSLAFPVYDSTLLQFVKQVSETELMNPNYAYVYSWNHLRTVEDELRFIEHAGLYEIDVLEGILSHYVLGGRTKGRLWGQAIEKGIFLKILLKMKELVDYWDRR